MSVVDFVLGKKQISIKNCVRDSADPRVSRCEVIVQEEQGIVRKGQIDVIGDNKTVFPLRKSGALTDEDFQSTIGFLKRGGWQHIVPSTKASLDKEEE